MTEYCDVSVVLLCKGRGADAAAYRPNRDESQWWSRRDALVRCVASYLSGPTPPNSMGKKELILLFDDDFARIHLALDNESSGRNTFLPTEQNVLSLFKRAAQSLNQTVQKDGLICRIHVDPTIAGSSEQHRSTTTKFKGGNPGKSSSSALPTGLDSKRQVLEYLQKKCSLDFLRSQGLNSNPSVILRKTNKKALMEVWGKWRKQENKKNGSRPAAGYIKQDNSSRSPGDDAIIESLYSAVFKESVMDRKADQEKNSPKVVVGTLHESCQEFPCFNIASEARKKTSQQENPQHQMQKLHVFLFLGAVRDMTERENIILKRLCEEKFDHPLVGIRFGTVPEFTSKILSILAFHYANGVIAKSIEQLLTTTQTCSEASLPTTSSSGPSTVRRLSSNLDLIATVPMSSKEVSIDLNHRNRLHWCLVRVVVCTLWRSRLASSTESSSVQHYNRLHLIFKDGVVLHLSETEFVAKLAEQHQAAPSEYQILAALQLMLKKTGATSSPHLKQPRPDDSTSLTWSKKKCASQIISKVQSLSTDRTPLVLQISPSASQGIARQFYESKDPVDSSSRSILAFVHISENISEVAHGSGDNWGRKIHRALRTACESILKTTVLRETVASNTVHQDYEAASITALQQFLYQNRVFSKSSPPCSSTTLLGAKRKKLRD